MCCRKSILKFDAQEAGKTGCFRSDLKFGGVTEQMPSIGRTRGSLAVQLSTISTSLCHVELLTMILERWLIALQSLDLMTCGCVAVHVLEGLLEAVAPQPRCCCNNLRSESTWRLASTNDVRTMAVGGLRSKER